MLERIKAPHQLDKIKSSNYLSNFCKSIAFMAMSILASESIAQEVPRDNNELLDSLHNNYDCRWSERFALNMPLPDFYIPGFMANGRVSNTLRKSGNIYVAERLNILPREHFENTNPLLVTGNEFGNGPWTPLSFNGVGPEGFIISTDYSLGYLLINNSQGDILDLLGDNCMTSMSNPEMADEPCGVKKPKELFYDAFADKLLFLDSYDGDLVSVDWQDIQNAYNSTQDTLEPIMHFQQEERYFEGVNEAAMLTPHHILFISNSNVPGMMTRTVNGWVSLDLVMNQEMYELVDDAAFIVWDQNYLGYVDLIMNNRTEFVRLQCGEVQSLYPGIPSFEQAHAGDLPACPDGQIRNSNFICEVECGENQAADENGECADLCVNEMACNNGEIGECQLPAQNANCDGVCLDGFESVNQECVAVCGEFQARDENGECADLCVNEMACNNGEIGECQMPAQNANCDGVCLEGFERVNQECVTVCGEFQARNENGECADLCINAMACNNGEIGECQMPAQNANCDGVCLDGFESVNQECVEQCNAEEVRNIDGECELQEIDMAPLPEDMGVSEEDMMIESDMGPQEDMMTEIDSGGMEEIDMESVENDMTPNQQEDAMMVRADRNVVPEVEDMQTVVPKNDMSRPKSNGKSDGGCNTTPGKNSNSSVFAMMALALGLNRYRRRKGKTVVNS